MSPLSLELESATDDVISFLNDEQSASDLAAAHPWNALGRPEDVADAALFLCSDES